MTDHRRTYEEAAAVARSRVRRAVSERDRLDAALDSGEATFSELARANADVRRAQAEAEAAEAALADVSDHGEAGR